MMFTKSSVSKFVLALFSVTICVAFLYSIYTGLIKDYPELTTMFTTFGGMVFTYYFTRKNGSGNQPTPPQL